MQSVLLGWILLAVAGLLAGAESPGFTGEIDLVFAGITTPGMTIQPDQVLKRDARFMLVADAGVWQPGYGVVHNRGSHRAEVRTATVDEARGIIELDLDVELGADPWIRGGRCRLAARLALLADGSWSGTWEQHLDDTIAAGAASARLRPRRSVAVPDFVPCALDEHPRLLFRRDDIAALQKKLETPFGRAWQAWAEGSDDLVALGTLYRLTGDLTYAQRAQAIVTAFGDEIDPSLGEYGSGTFGHRCVAVWLAYDLCFEAWDQDLRRRMEAFMRDLRLETRLYHVFGGHGGQCNWDPCSNYYGPSMGSIGLVSLALLGARSPRPDPPSAATPTPITPDPAFHRDTATPLVDLEPGVMPRHWLAREPLPYRLAWRFGEVYRHTPVFPAAGSTYGLHLPRIGQTPRTVILPYRALTGEAFGTAGLRLDLMAERITAQDELLTAEGMNPGLIPRSGPGMTQILYTVLRVADEAEVAMVTSHREARVWLLGLEDVELRHGALVHLFPGEFPMVVVLATDDTLGEFVLRFVGGDDPARQTQLDAEGRSQDRWRRDLAWWVAHDGADPVLLRQAERAADRVYRHLRRGIDDGGYGAETGAYADIASFYPLMYAGCYRRMLGRDLSPFPDATHLLTRKVMQQIYSTAGRSVAESISCSANLDPRWFAAGWDLTPDGWKPGVLWAWNRALGIAGADEAATIFAGKRHVDGLAATLTFLRYPLDLQPVHPDLALPKTWHADGLGFHLFRSGWDADAGLLQVLTRTRSIGGHNNPAAGAFTVSGLGRCWNTGARHKYAKRIEESVVLLADEAIHAGGIAREIDRWQEPDGSGGVAIDLAGIYSMDPRQTVDAGITGVRALAVDYSGTGDAPVLFAVADRLSGGGEKTWQWVLRTGDRDRVELLPDGFRIVAGKVSLRATVVVPTRPVIALAEHPDRVTVTGGDEFLVVATLQHGAAPIAVPTSGPSGPGAMVGGRRISFDGTRLRFSGPPAPPAP